MKIEVNTALHFHQSLFLPLTDIIFSISMANSQRSMSKTSGVEYWFMSLYDWKSNEDDSIKCFRETLRYRFEGRYRCVYLLYVYSICMGSESRWSLTPSVVSPLAFYIGFGLAAQCPSALWMLNKVTRKLKKKILAPLKPNDYFLRIT
jgi:hypothetical protein